jgi:hypothetical protein
MLVEADRKLIAKRAGATRLGLALLLKFFSLEGGPRATRASSPCDWLPIRRTAPARPEGRTRDALQRAVL